MSLAHLVDHTILKAEAKKEDVIRYCEEAKKYKFASVCVNTCYVSLVHKNLEESEVKTCCVIGFPLGAMSTKAKVFETIDAIENGADEIDMVINVGALKSEDYSYLKEDIEKVLNETKSRNKVLKVIVETALLTEEEKKKVCEIILELKADFVKTSTGFSSSGAKVEDIKLFKEIVGDEIKIKASGGIRTKEFAKELIEAGADRIGIGDGKILLD